MGTGLALGEVLREVSRFVGLPLVGVGSEVDLQFISL